MKLFVCVTLLVLILGKKSFADKSCRTCQGADCLKKNVLLLDCTKFVPALPFEDQLIINNNVGELEYGCLELEYYMGENLNHIQQCILAKDIESFCDTLEYSVKVNKCRIELLGLNRTRISPSLKVVAQVEVGETTKPPTTKEPEPTTINPETTTKKPETTTKKPETTTKKPETTTKKPETTAKPVDTTTQAVGTTTPSHASVTTAISLVSFIGALVLCIL